MKARAIALAFLLVLPGEIRTGFIKFDHEVTQALPWLMRKSLFILTAAAGILYLPLSSYQSGPAFNGEGNRTPSGSNATCSGVGCHGANNNHTLITLNLLEGANPVIDGKYKTNTLYTVTLQAINTALLPAAYGFQLTAIKSDQTQAGTITASGSLQTSTANTGGLTVVEHNTAIAANGGTATTPAFTWLSPPAGSGPVSFHVIMNAVNGNNFSDTTDHASTASFSLAENTLSVDNTETVFDVLIYPNPTSGILKITLPAKTGSDRALITILDIMGSEVYTTFNTSPRVTLDVSSWARGQYVVLISYYGCSAMRHVTIQ